MFSFFVYFALFVLFLLVAFKVYLVLTLGECKSNNKLTGKAVVITGANTGIGKETAIDLAARGARIILACRNLKKASQARGIFSRKTGVQIWIELFILMILFAVNYVTDDIIRETKNKNVVVRELDLASLSSVRRFAADILKTEAKIDILINNAGCALLEKQITADGLEYQMQSNHFGHFLLTNLLLGTVP
jgi:retinol dehydrogenase 12